VADLLILIDMYENDLNTGKKFQSTKQFAKEMWRREGPNRGGIIINKIITGANPVLFPKRIDGKWCIIYRHQSMNIYFTFSKYLRGPWKEGEPLFFPQKRMAGKCKDFIKMGFGSPPLETVNSWLCIDHRVEKNDNPFGKKYSLGYMLLDLKDPKNILYISDNVLEPETEWECKGGTPRVLFCCGAVGIDINGLPKNSPLDTGDRVLLHYGGADKVIGAAIGQISKRICSFQRKK